jgi:hypothetical protein
VPSPRRLAALALLALAFVAGGCMAAIPYDDQPANGYVTNSGQPLRVAVLDETGNDGAWRPAIDAALSAYGGASPMLALDTDPADANIVVHVRRYSDAAPPSLEGYRFQPGVGGFAAVYDEQGRACNFPPSPLPLNCDGEIATAYVYLNDGLPPGTDLELRRERLVLHELGHAMGLTRHSPDLDVAALAARYGW